MFLYIFLMLIFIAWTYWVAFTDSALSASHTVSHLVRTPTRRDRFYCYYTLGTILPEVVPLMNRKQRPEPKLPLPPLPTPSATGGWDQQEQGRRCCGPGEAKSREISCPRLKIKAHHSAGEARSGTGQCESRHSSELFWLERLNSGGGRPKPVTGLSGPSNVWRGRRAKPGADGWHTEPLSSGSPGCGSKGPVCRGITSARPS